MNLRVLKDDIEARWNAAAAGWDASALTSLYTEDAVFFGLLPDLYVGRPEIERYFRAYDGRLRAVSLDLNGQHLRALSGDTFLAQGFGDLRNHGVAGEVVANRVRTSLVITREAGRWRIALHHFSAPPPPLSPQA